MSEDDMIDVSLDLDKGDMLYQSDQELFLVVTEVHDSSYEFAVHGWREIADYRLEEYLDGEDGQLYRQSEVEAVVETERDADTQQKLNHLTELFSAYESGLSDEGPHKSFKLEDTDTKDESNGST
jgi:hypothetical protein